MTQKELNEKLANNEITWCDGSLLGLEIQLETAEWEVGELPTNDPFAIPRGDVSMDADDMPEIRAEDETGFALSMMDIIWGI